MGTRLAPEAYLEQIRSNTTQFADALATVPADTVVPSCPGWTARDLVDHLRTVQHFWAGVIERRLTDDAQVEQFHTERSEGAAGGDTTVEAVRSTGEALVDALRERSPDEPAWSWSADRSVGFTYRRQAHEACMHRIDAELTLAPDGSGRTLVDPMLAADGVDEILGLLAERTPAEGGATDASARLVRVVASDTATTWLVTVGTAAGIEVARHDPADGTVRPSAILTGTAEDLLCTFWGRPAITDLHRTGDRVLLADLDQAVAARPGG